VVCAIAEPEHNASITARVIIDLFIVINIPYPKRRVY